MYRNGAAASIARRNEARPVLCTCTSVPAKMCARAFLCCLQRVCLYRPLESSYASQLFGGSSSFRGFLIKADSEGDPGPGTYGRNQSQGANMLAAALAPVNGTVLWRAFEYGGAGDRARQVRVLFLQCFWFYGVASTVRACVQRSHPFLSSFVGLLLLLLLLMIMLCLLLLLLE